MTSGSLSVDSNESVGESGTGAFTQSGGTNSGGFWVSLGDSTASNGTYNLSGSGYLSTGVEYPGQSGNGSLIQTGGTNRTTGLYLGYNVGSSGTYNLSSSGCLSNNDGINESVGYSGTGSFTQSGGTNSLANRQLTLACNVGSSGSYSLGAGGYLSAGTEIIGYSGVGSFTQSGGTNSANLLYVGYNSGSKGTYVLGGGSLQVNGIINQGTFSGGATPAVLTATILDLSSGTWQNLGNVSLSMGTSSLLIVPAGFNPSSSGFASLSALGITHTIGTTLTVAAGQLIAGGGSITDPVDCRGTIQASTSSGINLNGGLTLYSGGIVSLGAGSVPNDAPANVTGGSLSTNTEIVGNSSTGSLTQSGGTNSVAGLYIGNKPGSSGTYSLSGSGTLGSTVREYVGYSGTGVFNHSCGTNTVANGLDIGYNTGSSGTYNLSGSGYLAVSGFEEVGFSGMGNFTQSGGTNSVGALFLDGNGSSAYNLGGGYLSAGTVEVGHRGTGVFIQSAGTNSIGGPLYVGYYSGNYRGSGTYNLGGGLLTTISVVSSSGTGTFNFSGGTLQASGSNTNFMSGLTAANVQAGSAIIDVQGFSDTVGQNLLHDPSLGATRDGGLTKLGSGVLTLTGTNTYTGGTTITAGTLIVANRLAIKDGTSLTVGSAAAFSHAPTVPDAVGLSDKPVSVPEPSTLALFGAGVILLFGRISRRRPGRGAVTTR